MAIFSKHILSGSTDGRGVKVVATASSGTTIHTANASATDEIWLYAYNSDSSSRLLTIQYGGTSSPDDDIKITLQPQVGLILVIPGLILTNSSVVRAYASAANVITISGYVNRIT